MLLTKSLILLAAFTVSASSIVEERATPVTPPFNPPGQSLFGQFDRDARYFFSSANAWDGSSSGAVTLQNREQTIEQDIRSIINSLQSQDPCSKTKEQIGLANSIYAPDMEKIVNILTSKRGQFATAGLGGIVQSDINTLASLSRNLVYIFLQKACPDSKAAAQSFAARIHAIFSSPTPRDITSSSSGLKRTPPQMPVRATKAQKQGIYTKYDKDIKALIQSINRFDSTIAGAVPINNAIQDVEEDINSLTKTIHPLKNCTRISQVIKLARSIFIPDMAQAVRALQGLESQRPTTKPWFKGTIDTLGGYSERFGMELVRVACPPQKYAAQEVLDAIKRIFGDDDRFPPRSTGPDNLKRTPGQIIALLKQLDADLKAGTSRCTAWKGDVDGATPIQNAEYQIEKDVDLVTTQAKKEPVASSADSQTIIGYLNNPIEPDVLAFVNAFIAKKAQFQAIGLYSTVKNDFASLITKFTALSNALIAAASSDQKTAATNAKNKILADLKKGNDAYP